VTIVYYIYTSILFINFTTIVIYMLAFIRKNLGYAPELKPSHPNKEPC
jgi:hypothetical protein